MSRLRNTIATSRGTLKADDPTLTIEDLQKAFFGGKVSRAGVTSCLKRRDDLRSVVNDYSKKRGLPNSDLRQAMANFFYRIESAPVCEACGLPTRFNRLIWHYARFCSSRCQNNDPGVKRRHAETNLAVYGSENAAKSQRVKDKMLRTLSEKYNGATCYLATDEGKEKARATVRKRYGVDFVMQNPTIKGKRDKTMLSRYGVMHGLQNEVLMRKRDRTCIDRFGELYPGAKRLRELAKETRLSVWDSLPSVFPGYEIQCDRESFLGVYEHENTWRCKSCGAEFTRQGAPFCRCQLKWKEQNNLFDFVREICPDAEFRNKSILSGKELDVVVPSKKIAFEYDGLYWHSEESGKDRMYHLNKTVAAKAAGYRLIHVFEDEWLGNQEITKAFIRSVLDDRRSSKFIPARRCRVKILDKKEAYAFLSDNHILGPTNSPENIGLVYDDKVVAVCSFKRIDSSGGWYLERYATLIGTRVQGGCGKLLAFFIRKNSPSRIRTFADKRWSVGGMYERIGFKRVSETGPVYWYSFRGEQRRTHRFLLRKKNKKMFPVVYDPTMTEKELARANGYLRIWDCGQIVFEMKPGQVGR